MKDLKYLMAYTIPITAILAINNQSFYSFLTVFYAFGIIPILEIFLEKKNERFSDLEIENRVKNKLFDWLLYLNIPLVFFILFFGFNTLVNKDLDLVEKIGLIFSIGIVLGTNGINVAHELGHRRSRIEQFMSKLLLLPSLYMHFYIEHNYGHHKNVATPEDPATAQKNQSVYNFWITSVFGQYINAWKIQFRLLKSGNKNFFSIKNDMIYYLLIQIIYLLFILIIFGLSGLIFAISISIVSFLLLETINYIEHYGLLRLRINGRYEKVRNFHSWNSDHVIGRIVLYELTRHSDHHYRASKKYQILQSEDESPRLPYGYPTSMLIALIPSLWFGLMNPRIK